MSDSNPKRDVFPEETRPRNTGPGEPASGQSEAGMRVGRGEAKDGETDRTRPNPHDESGAPKTATQTAGLMTGMFLPTVIVFVVGLAVILYFLFLR